MEISDGEEQRTVIKFLTKLGKNGPQIFQDLSTVYGENALKQPTVFKWVKRFREGRESVKDDERSGRPSTSKTDENIARVKNAVFQDKRKTVRMIAEELNLNKDTVHTMLRENLGMKKLCAKIVPKLLSPDQKNRRIQCCQDWIDAEEETDFLDRIITGDESWFYEFDPELKSQSMEWKKHGESRTKKSKKARSNIKTLLIVFFDTRGIVHHEFVPPGQTVNGQFYVEVLKRLKARVFRVRPDLARNNSWILHHDNAPAHTSLRVREFLAKNSIILMEHLPYSPDLAPCDFFLFPKCKMLIRGRHLGAIEMIKEETTRLLKSITEDELKRCFQQWKKRWQKCILLEGEYFEGDKVELPN